MLSAMRRLAAAETVEDIQLAANHAISFSQLTYISLLECCPLAAFPLQQANVALQTLAYERDIDTVVDRRSEALRQVRQAVSNWNTRIC